MITEDIKQRLVNNAVKAILNRKELFYSDFHAVRAGKIEADEETLVTFCLVASTFAHNIAIWPNGIRTLRAYSVSWRAADVFELTNSDETYLIHISHKDGSLAKHQTYGDFKLGRLAYRDDTHEFFRPGKGGWKCDFIDLDYGHLIEAKYKYFEGGSPSGLHDAEYLLDYDDNDIRIYKTTLVGKKRVVLPGTPKLAEFKDVMKPRQHLINVPGISTEFMWLIQSGELIPRIEKELEAQDFEWPE